MELKTQVQSAGDGQQRGAPVAKLHSIIQPARYCGKFEVDVTLEIKDNQSLLLSLMVFLYHFL